MKQPLISITLSAYNVAQYIAASMECIINQTLKDIEIICIDDGSTDGTLKILQKYAAKDQRIKLIAKDKNEGLAEARNLSLKLAKGKYITFVDGDDIFDKTMLQKAYNLAEKEKSDLVLWDYAVFYKTDEILEIDSKKSDLVSLKPNDKEALLKRPAFTCTKLLKTETAKKINIHFPKGLTRQDIPVHWHLITAVNNISILPEKLVFYRQQSQATTAKTDERIFDLAKVMDITKKYLHQNNLYEKYKDVFLESQLNLLYGMYDKADKEIKKEAFKKLFDRLGNEQWEYIYSKQPLRKQARWFYKNIRNDLMAKIEYNIWLLARRLYRTIKKL